MNAATKIPKPGKVPRRAKAAAKKAVTAPDTRPKNESGKRIGRPKTRHVKLQVVATRCPTTIFTYMKGLSPFISRSLTDMYEQMLTQFIQEEPWKHGLHWRRPKSATSYAGNRISSTGWVLVNINLTPEKAALVKETAEKHGQSVAGFCYTAIFWWISYVYPPNKLSTSIA